jgi:hypothetical protein
MARSSACLDFLLLLLSSDSIAFPFYFFSFLPRLRGFCFLLQMFTGGETYAPEAEMSFLPSLVSSPSAAQTTTKDLWSAGLSPQAQAEI